MSLPANDWVYLIKEVLSYLTLSQLGSRNCSRQALGGIHLSRISTTVSTTVVLTDHVFALQEDGVIPLIALQLNVHLSELLSELLSALQSAARSWIW
jgi:hypothetical protein